MNGSVDSIEITRSFISATSKGYHVNSLVNAATTEGVILTGLSDVTIDGVTLSDEDSILIKDQQDATENGIYIVTTNSTTNLKDLLRPSDLITEFPANTVFFIRDGTTNGGKGFFSKTQSTIGLDEIIFNEFTTDATNISSSSTDPSHIQQAVIGPNGPLVLYDADIATSGDIISTGKTFLDELSVNGPVKINAESIKLRGAVLDDCATGGLLVKVFAFGDQDTSANSTFPTGRPVTTTLSGNLSYDSISFTAADGKVYSNFLNVVYAGFIQVPAHEQVSFYVSVTGGIQVFIDDKKVLDDFSIQPHRVLQFQVDFTSTRSITAQDPVFLPILINWRNAGEEGSLQVQWSSNSIPKTIIPKESLVHSSTESFPSVTGPLRVLADSTFAGPVTFKEDVTFGKGVFSGTVNVSSLKVGTDANAAPSFKYDDSGLTILNPTSSNFNLVSSASDVVSLKLQNTGSDSQLRIYGTRNSAFAMDSISQEFSINLSGQPGINLARNEDGNVLTSLQSLFVGSNARILGSLGVSGDIFVSGTMKPVQLGLGLDGPSSGSAMLTLSGLQSDISSSGPHITTYIATDKEPVFNICSYNHDNVSVNFDATFDGINGSSSVDTAAQIRKYNKRLEFNWYNNLVSSFQTALDIDLETGNIMTSCPNPIFSMLSDQGLYISPHPEATGTWMKFFAEPDLRGVLSNDFWTMGLVRESRDFVITRGPNSIPVLSLSSTDNCMTLSPIQDNQAGPLMRANGVISCAGLSSSGNMSGTSLNLCTSLYIGSSTDAVGDGKAAAIIKGGVHIGKNLVVNNQVLTNRVNISAKSPALHFNARLSGTGPMVAETSPGTRIILKPNSVPNETNVAIGVDETSGMDLWYTVPAPLERHSHVFYAGATKILSLDGTGNMRLTGSGSSVVFEGLNKDGLILKRINTGGHLDIVLEDWRVRRMVNGNFALMKSGQSIIELSVDKGTFVGQLASTVLTSGNVTVMESVKIGDTLRLVGKGLYALENSILRWDDGSLRMGLKQFDTDISSNQTTTVNRWNGATFEVFSNSNPVLTVDTSGVTVSQGNLTAWKSTLFIDKISAGSEIGASTMTSSKLQLYDDSQTSLKMSTESSKVDFVLDNTGLLTLSTPGTVNVKSNAMVIDVNGRIQITNDLAVRALLVQSSSLFSEGINFIPHVAGLPRLYSFSQHFTEENGPCWYYMGPINTSPGGMGLQESGQGKLTVEFDKGLVVRSFVISSGTMNVTVHKQGDMDPLDFVVYQDENQDFHLFMHVLTNIFLAQIDIRNLISVDIPPFVREGSGSFPDGTLSRFKESWTRIPMQISGTSETFGSLTVMEGAMIGGNIFVRGHGNFARVNVGAISVGTETGFQVYQGEDQIIKASKDAVSFSGSLIPQGQQTIGSPDFPYTGIFVRDAVVGKMTISDQITVPHCNISESLVCRYASVMGSLDCFGDVNFHGRISLNSELFLSAGFHVTSEKSTVDYDLDVGGNLTTTQLTIHQGTSGLGIDFGGNVVAGIRGIQGGNVLDLISEAGFIFHNRGVLDAVVFIDPQNGTLGYNADSFTILPMNQTGGGQISIRNDGGVVVSGSGVQLEGETVITNDLTVAGDLILEGGILRLHTEKITNGSGDVTFFENLEGTLAIGDGAIVLRTDMTTMATPIEFSDMVIFDKSAHFQSRVVFDTDIQAGSIQLKDSVSFSDGGFDLFSTEEGIFSILQNGFELLSLHSDVGTSRTVLKGSVEVADDSWMKGNLRVSGELSVGVQSSCRSGILIDSSYGNDAALRFRNDSQNSGKLYYAASTATENAGTLVLQNDGGDLLLRAAGKVGLTIEKTSGNGRITGQLYVDSGLDYFSTASSTEQVAALNVRGGAILGGSVKLGKGLIIENSSGYNTEIFASNVTKGYSLVLPDDLPDVPDQYLSCDLNGQLCWRSVGGGGSDGSGSDSSPVMSTFRLTVPGSGTVQGLKMSGNKFMVDVLCSGLFSDGSSIESLYSLVGLYSAQKGWQLVSQERYGDEVGLSFIVDSATGQVQYTVGEDSSANEIILSWTNQSQRESDSTGSSYPTLEVGGDYSTEGPTGQKGAFFTVKGGEYTETDAGSASGSTLWSGTYIGAPTVNVLSSEVNIPSASTVYIEGAPKKTGIGPIQNQWALNIASGSVFVGSTKDAVAVDNAALVVNGGVGFGGNTFCGKDLYINKGHLVLGSGTPTGGLLHGKVLVGSSYTKTVTVQVSFSATLASNDYIITGNVVTNDPSESGVYICTFKALNPTGCIVTVCRIDGDAGWTDTLLAVHYQVMMG